MTIVLIEDLLANISQYLMAPVLACIILLLIYAIYAMGRFAGLYYIRRKNASLYAKSIKTKENQWYSGYIIHNHFIGNPGIAEDELEVFALKRLENLRVVTRIAPMLGLIATMVPMGPALKALSDGNIQGISENLIVAFTAVIWGLVISSLTFWPATVKKRWFAAELINIRKLRGE